MIRGVWKTLGSYCFSPLLLKVAEILLLEGIFLFGDEASYYKFMYLILSLPFTFNPGGKEPFGGGTEDIVSITSRQGLRP